MIFITVSLSYKDSSLTRVWRLFLISRNERTLGMLTERFPIDRSVYLILNEHATDSSWNTPNLWHELDLINWCYALTKANYSRFCSRNSGSNARSQKTRHKSSQGISLSSGISSQMTICDYERLRGSDEWDISCDRSEMACLPPSNCSILIMTGG